MIQSERPTPQNGPSIIWTHATFTFQTKKYRTELAILVVFVGFSADASVLNAKRKC